MIEPCEIPPRALLLKYRTDGAFADCYATHVAGGVTLARYVEAFYTTWLFKLERGVLALAGRPSSDEHARQLAQGARDAFAAWTVESRDADQLLLCDILGRTRSWLMVAPEVGPEVMTRLYFGSAVVPKPDRHRRPILGAGFHALLGFHRMYSRALLSTARRRLQRPTSARSRPPAPT